MKNKKWNKVMIDIETLSTKPNAVILSIAAIPFNETEISDKVLYEILPVASQLAVGRTIEQSTLNWWSDQDVNPLMKPTQSDNLEDYTVAINYFMSTNLDKEFEIWANSPIFDIGILKDFYNNINFSAGHIFNYSTYRDVRTVRSLIKGSYDDIKNENKHDPASDCLYQIQVVQRMYEILDSKSNRNE